MERRRSQRPACAACARFRAHARGKADLHHSAAALWGMPTIGEWPATVHVAAIAGARGRTKGDVHEHVLPDGVTLLTHRGELLTSVADTAVGLACVLPFADAVAIADFALHVPRGGSALCTGVDLESSLQLYRGRKGYPAARAVIRFADGLSGSPGESHSRANMHLCGFVIPELQVPFHDSCGLIGVTDFFWRSINRIGEFDGLGKYLREEFARGKDPAQVVIDEKIREDRLRACGPSVSRWLFNTATSPQARRFSSPGRRAVGALTGNVRRPPEQPHHPRPWTPPRRSMPLRRVHPRPRPSPR